jgi:hypothetical protein
LFLIERGHLSRLGGADPPGELQRRLELGRLRLTETVRPAELFEISAHQPEQTVVFTEQPVGEVDDRRAADAGRSSAFVSVPAPRSRSFSRGRSSGGSPLMVKWYDGRSSPTVSILHSMVRLSSRQHCDTRGLVPVAKTLT